MYLRAELGDQNIQSRLFSKICFYILLIFIFSGPVIAKEWTTFNMDNSRTACNDLDTFSASWPSLVINMPDRSMQPLYNRTEIIIPTTDGDINIFSRTTGELLNRLSLGVQEINSAALYGDKDLYVVCNTNILEKVDLQTGNVLSYPEFSESVSCPIIVQDKYVVAGVGKCVWAFNLDDLSFVDNHCESDSKYFFNGTYIASSSDGITGIVNDSQGYIQGISLYGSFSGAKYSYFANNCPWGNLDNQGFDCSQCLNDINPNFVPAYYQNAVFFTSLISDQYYTINGCRNSGQHERLIRASANSAAMYENTILPGNPTANHSLCIDENMIFMAMKNTSSNGDTHDGIYCYSATLGEIWHKNVILPADANVIKINHVKINGIKGVKKVLLVCMGLPATDGGDGNIKTLYALDPSNGDVLWHSDDNVTPDTRALVQTSGKSVFYSDGSVIIVYCPDLGYPIHGCQRISSGGANLFTGNVVKSVVDAELPGPGLSFKFVRTYNSFSDANIGLGRRWTHNYDLRLLKGTGSNIILLRGDGKKITFQYQSKDGLYKPITLWEHSTIASSADSGFTLTEKNGLQYFFHGFVDSTQSDYFENGRLKEILDRNSNQINFQYTQDGYIDKITDPLGRIVYFSYDVDGNIYMLNLPDNRKISYLYSDKELIYVSTTRGSGVINSSYNYNAAGLLSDYSEPRLAAGDKKKSYTYYSGGVDDKKVQNVRDGNGMIVEGYTYEI